MWKTVILLPDNELGWERTENYFKCPKCGGEAPIYYRNKKNVVICDDCGAIM